MELKFKGCGITITRRRALQFLLLLLLFVGTYHLSRCMLLSFSESFVGNMVGRICVWRLLGTSDQSEYHWPSLVISYTDNSCFSVWSNHLQTEQWPTAAETFFFMAGCLVCQGNKHIRYLPGSNPRHPLQSWQISRAVGQLQCSWKWWWERHYDLTEKGWVSFYLFHYVYSDSFSSQKVKEMLLWAWHVLCVF